MKWKVPRNFYISAAWSCGTLLVMFDSKVSQLHTTKFEFVEKLLANNNLKDFENLSYSY